MPWAVVTREPALAAPYLRALEELGLRAQAMPVIAVERAEPTALAAALARLDEHDLVAVASANAAALVGEALSSAPSAARATFWAVGQSSAAPLRDRGVAVKLAQAPSAEGLARSILAAAGARPRRALLPRAEDGRPELALALRAAGYQVDELVVYRSVARAASDLEVAGPLARCRAGDVELFALFAPSQVRALAALLDPQTPTSLPAQLAATRVHYVAIGETTARALAQAGVTPLVAAHPTPEAMANAVATRYPRRP